MEAEELVVDISVKEMSAVIFQAISGTAVLFFAVFSSAILLDKLL